MAQFEGFSGSIDTILAERAGEGGAALVRGVLVLLRRGEAGAREAAGVCDGRKGCDEGGERQPLGRRGRGKCSVEEVEEDLAHGQCGE